MIWGITIVKNEDDIIESMIRYNMGFIHKMFVVDNGSDDYTKEIIRALIDEGYDIVLESDYVLGFNQVKVINGLIYRIMKGEFGKKPDYIIPIDADEFLVAEKRGEDVRDIIESFDRNVINKIKWRTYIPTEEELADGFVPLFFSKCKKREYEIGEKMIIPTNLISEGFCVNNGNHYTNLANTGMEKVNERLRMAHYPIRSVTQAYQKIVLGYMSRVSTPTYEKGRSPHIEKAYYDILNGTKINLEYIQNMAMHYCCNDMYIPSDAWEEFAFDKINSPEKEIISSFPRKTDKEKIILKGFETLANRYKEAVVSQRVNPIVCDIDAMKAIEQYSYRKMKVEREQKDHITRKCAILDMCMSNAIQKADCIERITKELNGRVIIQGVDSFTMLIAQRLKSENRFVGWSADEYDANEQNYVDVRCVIAKHGVETILIQNDFDRLLITSKYSGYHIDIVFLSDFIEKKKQ